MSKKLLFKNVASLSLIQIANYIFPLITIPITSRLFGPEKFGVINYAAAFMVYFNLLINYGFDLTATRKISKDANNIILRNYIFSEVMNVKILLFVVSLIIFSVSLYNVQPLNLEKKVAIFTFIGCIGVVFNQNWLFQSMQELHKVTLVNFGGRFLFTIAIVAAIKQQEDYIWQPLISSLITICISVITFFWSLKRYKVKYIQISFKNIINVLWSEKIVFFSIIIVSLYTTTNIVILGFYQNETQVGYYSAGQRLMDVIRSVISLPLSMALFPYIGKAFGENKKSGIIIVQKALPLVMLCTGLMGVIMVSIGPNILKVFFGNKYEPAVQAFQVLSFIPMVVSLSNLFGVQIMLHLKMDKLFLYTTSIGATISIILNVILVQKYGFIGTAIAWLITEILITLTMYVLLRINGINPVDTKFFRLYFIKQQLNPLINTLVKANRM
ncbi:flippase [Spirosoma radiotolerans]|uniref:Uncharacterized protein n=1 Tax=Spirosoma radiotolerans TaxID=1379870 RepID=A0A0E3ZX00_9BACT|nr:flippase [Spirosoma radiotolerans]AKD56045.1 hypothetical protein SD10_15205 [Spirosoma radiotolerans]